MGSDDYLAKPYSTKELILRVNKLISRIYKDNEPAHVDQIKVFSSDKDIYEFSVSIKYRYDRAQSQKDQIKKRS